MYFQNDIQNYSFFFTTQRITGDSLVFVNKISKFATITVRETRTGDKKNTLITLKDEDLFH